MTLLSSIRPHGATGGCRRFLVIVGCTLIALGQAHGGDAADFTSLEKQLSGLREQGKYQEAIPVAQTLLALTETAHGAEAWQTALRLNDLGSLYNETGDYIQAEPLLLHALAIQEKTRGPEHLDTAGTLNTLALLYTAQARFAKAQPLFNRALKIQETSLGRDDPEVATTLDNLASLYQKTGEDAKALPLYERALAIREKRLGKEHPDTAQSLNNLGSLHRSLRHFDTAAAMLERALAINEKALGPNHPETAATVFNLAVLYQVEGDFAKAETNFLRAIRLTEQAYGPDHSNTAEALRSLALLYLETGRYPQAESTLQRALAIAAKREESEPLATTTILNNLARLYKRMGNYQKSEAMSLTVLDKQEHYFGTNNINLAPTLNGLGLLYREIGDFDRAEKMLTRALELKERNLPPDDPSLALSLNNLAQLYHDEGDYARVEALQQRDLAICEKRLGPNHPDTLVTVNNLASLYATIRDYPQAETMFKRVLQAREATQPVDPTAVADALNNLAGVYQKTGGYDQAEPLLERALRLREDSLGPNHAATAQSLQNLGMLYADRKKFVKARPLVERALRIRETAFGHNHPDVANSLENLAHIDQDLGNFTQAETNVGRALGIYTNSFGLFHPGIASCLTTLARLKLEFGQTNEALAFAERARQIQEKMLANVLAFTSEQQRLGYQEHNDPYSLLATLGSARLLALALLHNKGIVLDSFLEDRSLTAASRDPRQREVLSQLRRARQALAGVALTVENQKSEERQDQQQKQEALAAQVDDLETTLARNISALGRIRSALSATVEQLQAALPGRAAVVEMVRYSHFLKNNLSEERYGAVVILPRGEPFWVPLGAATSIEKNIQLYQHQTRSREDDPAISNVLRQLDVTVWLPIAKALPADTRTVIISPDSSLNFVSFGTLLDATNEFLAERYFFTYVSSSRDLLRERSRPEAGGSLLVWANPDFGAAPPSDNPAGVPALALRTGALREFRDLTFRPLPGSETEARRLQSRAADFGFERVELYLAAQATESALDRVQSPKVLHLATHGFFLPDTSLGPLRPLLNPMYRSGLALAGAQHTLAAWSEGRTPPPEDDGIVTAEEVGGLNLTSTWLVVLSACDTGGGEARSGEGVLGLRRGFVQAGAQNLLVTLWPIDDEQTGGLITDFYETACRTGNAPLALAKVQRDWLIKLRREKGIAKACKLAGPFILSFQGRFPNE